MRKKLQLHFRKKTIKNEILITHEFIKYSFFFLKIICRAINMGLKFIFCDESGFFLFNNNFYNWSFDKEEIFFRKGKNEKVNLLLAVSNEKVFHFKINKENTTSSVFKVFMDELLQKMSKEERESHIIILDNFSGHLTYDLFQFYQENNMKILFNIPYFSTFNMVENVFRLIKNITYKNYIKK